MFASTWHWLTATDAGLAARIAGGTIIFVIFAVVDLRKRGNDATRWREYLFLLATVAAAIAYGVINDQITSRISWEYFYYGKGLAQVLGDAVPPNPHQLHWQAVQVGAKATWTVGLLMGVALLLANNPDRNPNGRFQLPYHKLLRTVPLIFLITIVCASVLGYGGYHGWITPFSPDFLEMTRRDEFRPDRFIAVFGIHLGGYIGGALGTIVSVLWIRQQRRKIGKRPAGSSP